MKAILLGLGSVFITSTVVLAGPSSIVAPFTGPSTNAITANDKGTTFGPGWKVLMGAWRINTKRLLEGQLQDESNPADVLAYTGSQYKKKLDASVTITASDLNKYCFGGIVFGFQDVTTYYVLRLCINGTDSGLQVIKEQKGATGYEETCLGGTVNLIGDDVNLVENNDYRLTVRQSGTGDIQFELTNAVTKEVVKSGSFNTTPSIPVGYVGLLATAPYTFFKDFKATFDQ